MLLVAVPARGAEERDPPEGSWARSFVTSSRALAAGASTETAPAYCSRPKSRVENARTGLPETCATSFVIASGTAPVTGFGQSTRPFTPTLAPLDFSTSSTSSLISPAPRVTPEPGPFGAENTRALLKGPSCSRRSLLESISAQLGCVPGPSTSFEAIQKPLSQPTPSPRTSSVSGPVNDSSTLPGSGGDTDGCATGSAAAERVGGALEVGTLEVGALEVAVGCGRGSAQAASAARAEAIARVRESAGVLMAEQHAMTAAAEGRAARQAASLRRWPQNAATIHYSSQSRGRSEAGTGALTRRRTDRRAHPISLRTSWSLMPSTLP
ncbi:MAG: hypothetical protein IPM79_25500 [Polyangiaceae bacterium]|nr:hypothetical protein [Polyangiaceae bacterium]